MHRGIPELRASPKRCSMARRRARAAVPRCISSAGAVSSELPRFQDRSAKQFQLGIMGDLHLEPNQMPLFQEACSQFSAHMSARPHSAARMVQLGDLAGYKFQPGSRASFQVAKGFMDSFPVPYALILGNHDLEGEEFETDEENLAAWHEAFQQPHYWAAPLGPALLIGLSTTRFRSNAFSVHEVHIDDEQLQWLEGVLQQHQEQPIIMFTHAPPIGSGLKVLQEVHVKNRCAWLNHSSDPGAFLRLVEAHPNIRLWFSGHFHLSHNYLTSISSWGTTAFVQTGVIGRCNRDGFRHSRFLEGDQGGYRLYTLDHDTGLLRLDLAHGWHEQVQPRVLTPAEQMIGDESATNSGWLCSQLDCDLPQTPQQTQWFQVGPNSLLALQDRLLLEYDMHTRSPIGLVAPLPEGTEVVLEHAGGEDGQGGAASSDGSSVTAVLVLDNLTKALVSRYERNESGGFFRIYQPNKWRLKKEQAAAAAAAAAASQPVAVLATS